MLRSSSGKLFAGAAVFGLSWMFAPQTARAHFRLVTPESWAMQDSQGSPQKSAPCGETDSPTVASQAVPTNMVTTFRPGQTITITINETVFHPGHYRVALAVNNRSELPPAPPVTVGASACGSTVIQATPVFPVLADGLLRHTARLSGTQTMQVTLPSNVTCTNCTLQVIQFMSDHGINNPGGCFYHHCANIAIQGAPMDGGTATAADATVDGARADASMARDTSSGIDAVTGTGGSTGASLDAAAETGSGGAGGSSTTGSGGSGGNTSSGGAGGSAAGAGGSGGAGTGGASGSGGAGGARDAGPALVEASPTPDAPDEGGGCSIALTGAAQTPSLGAVALWALSLLGLRRRGRSRSH